MRYAFITVSIFAIWVAVVLLAVWTTVGTVYLLSLALGMTIVLFLIGFGRRR